MTQQLVTTFSAVGGAGAGFFLRTSVLVAAALAAGSASTKPPATKPAAKWGRAKDGLRCRLTADKAEVPMGSRVVFGLRFRFEPKGADPKVNILNRCVQAWRARLTFTNTKTGKVFRRTPFDVGMPPAGPRAKDVVLLRSMPKRLLDPDRMNIYLLSEKGEQIPPGEYRVVAAYVNDARPEVEVFTAGDGSVGRRPYKGPWKFWKGKLVSAPMTLKVTPVEVKQVELKTNSAMTVKHVKRDGKDRIACSWSQDAPKIIRAKLRPGYIVGRRYSLHVLLDGKEENDSGGGLRGGTWCDGGSTRYLPPRIVQRFLAGRTVCLRADVVIFETSVAPRHMWSPESGDFKVLWKGTVEGTLRPDKR